MIDDENLQRIRVYSNSPDLAILQPCSDGLHSYWDGLQPNSLIWPHATPLSRKTTQMEPVRWVPIWANSLVAEAAWRVRNRCVPSTPNSAFVGNKIGEIFWFLSKLYSKLY